MKGSFFLLLLLCVNYSILGQTKEPIFFYSSFEKITLSNFLKSGQTDTLGLLLASDRNITIEKRNLIYQDLQLFISELKEARKSFKTSKSFLYFVFSETRKKYLKKFVAGQAFSQLFTSGEFNCVSGTALLGWVFNQLQISIQIRETPFHVYLVAEYKPNKFSLIESTSKENWLITGRTNIAIEEKNYKNPETGNWCLQAAFCSNINKTNCPKSYLRQIDLINLAGLQYLNSAIAYYNQSQIISAYPSLQKAELLYPGSKRIEGLNNLIKVNGLKIRFQSASSN